MPKEADYGAAVIDQNGAFSGDGVIRGRRATVRRFRHMAPNP